MDIEIRITCIEREAKALEESLVVLICVVLAAHGPINTCTGGLVKCAVGVYKVLSKCMGIFQALCVRNWCIRVFCSI